MPTNRDLRGALLKKLGVTPQALSLRVQKKKEHSPMSTEDATYLIAHETGIRIDKYLTAEQVDRVRQLHGSTRAHNAHLPQQTKPKVKAIAKGDIRFPDGFKVSSSLLSPAKLAEARSMAAIYPVLYVLENSMREAVKRVMSAVAGQGWWDAGLTSGKLKDVHKKASDRMKTETGRLRWHQTRGAHPIDYVDLGDLATIILGRQGHFFPDVLGDDREWFIQFMKELEPSRNVVCHMNPLNQHNIEDVRLRLKKWETLIKNAGAAIPPAST